jgi:hypothetical protein
MSCVVPPEKKAAAIAGLRYAIPKGAGILRRRAGHWLCLPLAREGR